MKEGQYERSAERWSAMQYADSATYLEHRARLVDELGTPLERGATVLDLACGDGGLGVFLRARGLRYLGVDATPAMVEEARRNGIDAELGDLNEYEPAEPVAATTVFRAIYYATDRPAFFRRTAAFTERKFVFDLNPRQVPLAQIRRELRDAGFARVDARPFLVPQRVALPRPALALLRALERSGPLARLALRFRFTYLVAASREMVASII